MTAKDKVIGLAKATHFGPLCLVVTISFILAMTQLSFTKSLEIALAIFAGQCVVGWSNDLIDYPRDKAANRLKKPLVQGVVTPQELEVGIAIALVAAILLSFLGPLGVKGGFLHMLGIGSATAYNFGVKATWFSPLPYAISFGAMPWQFMLRLERILQLGYLLISC
ncbi:MAG: UbiA family prenyltransferase [Actinomycetota bacterium]